LSPARSIAVSRGGEAGAQAHADAGGIPRIDQRVGDPNVTAVLIVGIRWVVAPEAARNFSGSQAIVRHGVRGFHPVGESRGEDKRLHRRSRLAESIEGAVIFAVGIIAAADDSADAAGAVVHGE